MGIPQLLATLQRDHDRDPHSAAAALRGLAIGELPAEELPRFTWLLNHVLGQKLGAWDEVHAIYSGWKRKGSVLALAVLRNVACAARLAGDDGAAMVAQDALQDAARLDDGESALVVDVAALMYGMAEPADDASAARFVALCDRLDAWDRATSADALVAAMANNIASAFLELPAARFANPLVAAALERGACASRHFWKRAGTWLQAMRAEYLVAMAMNRVGKPEEASACARTALEAIARNGPQDVDEAFIQLELAHAERAIGRRAEAEAARGRADALAAAFGDDDLLQWFERVAAQLRALPAARRASASEASGVAS